MPGSWLKDMPVAGRSEMGTVLDRAVNVRFPEMHVLQYWYSGLIVGGGGEAHNLCVMHRERVRASNLREEGTSNDRVNPFMGAGGAHGEKPGNKVTREGAPMRAGATVKRASESRKHPRIAAKIPVTFKLGDTTARTHSVNMGGGGLRLETSALPCGAELVVRFRTGKHQAYIQAKARVVYTQPDVGCGVAFTEINPESQQRVLRAIHSRGAERRKAPRVALATQIQIQDSMALAYSRDLSVGGIFIDTKENWKIGTSVDLRFHLNDNGPVVIASGEVRYAVLRMGVGVQFTEVSSEDRKRIQDFVESSNEILPEPIDKDLAP